MTRLCVKRLLVLCHVDPQAAVGQLQEIQGSRFYGNDEVESETNWTKMIQIQQLSGILWGFHTRDTHDFSEISKAGEPSISNRRPAPSTASWPFMGSDRTVLGIQWWCWQHSGCILARDYPLELHVRDFFWWIYLFLRKYSHTELCKTYFVDETTYFLGFGLWLSGCSLSIYPTIPQILTGWSTLATSFAHPDARLLSFGGLGVTPKTWREGTFFAEIQRELMVIEIYYKTSNY